MDSATTPFDALPGKPCAIDCRDVTFPYELHPSFSSPLADIVLCASDGVTYRMSSYTLRLASGFFRDLFSLPQPITLPEKVYLGSPPGSGKGIEELFTTCESSDVLTPFLMLIGGIPIHTPLHEWGVVFSYKTSYFTDESTDPRSCFDIIERVLRLAECWDAPGPLSYIRLGLHNPELVKRDPLRLYAIASHFGWECERNWAAQHTLMLDLSQASPAAQETLECMSSKDLLSLLKLHYRRREEFRELLDEPGRFSVGNSDETLCPRCNETPLDNSTWIALKAAMVMEMERRPLGDSIVGFEVDGIGGENFAGVLTWPEADACFKATCTKEGCGGLNYDICATLKQIAWCVDSLSLDL
ncbi:hypothetical protein BDP27DRAFT_190737 [Rhodocollybia butyracea]|uniref:BTB domain-containing protein n=1 Tax=Rhodocollybia butyracea TaxID=206335 RepID=A0A9P5UBT5_9AGAR|nr:hypothetical protein BDP27DRAFT_190737 [Rhodocollybia butyracea]